MIDYIKGQVAEINPTQVVIDCNGVGYSMLISLQTYEAVKDEKVAKIYVHHHLREDDEEFYGFYTKDEREIFRLLISVSGIGVGTARMMLSSMSSDEVREAILSENIAKIKSVKGIGAKSAQRVILELKDKIVKGEGSVSVGESIGGKATIAEEAVTALVLLGFSKPNVHKAVHTIQTANPEASVEEIIKEALKIL
ncbi:MAG: Holliday junction branch migration protein RuvA [Bacteroidales bacterium]|nr:Holliday junction branch migration protein RuvA [Bacteroidales bacterium]